jgi:hypothetical protein
MKIKYLFFLPLLIILGAGCVKHDDNPVAVPTGNFTGQFIRLRKNAAGTGFDTLKINLNIKFDTQTGYAVTGDTAKHAASYGNYGLDNNYMLFNDLTKVSSKYHLSGYYLYEYDGSNLNLHATYADTLGLFYILKRQ